MYIKQRAEIRKRDRCLLQAVSVFQRYIIQGPKFKFPNLQVAVAFSDWFSLLIGLPSILGGEELWPLAFAFPGIAALALVLILPFCPESPKYTLAVKGDREKVRLIFFQNYNVQILERYKMIN